MPKESRRVSVDFNSQNMLKVISVAIELLLIIGIVAYILYTIESMYLAMGNLNTFADTAILNSLVAIALVELYLGAKTYFSVDGKQSMSYIIDAALSFVVREIIILILGKTYTAPLVLSFGVLVIILVAARKLV